MAKLSALKAPAGGVRKRKRRGCGPGSGHGKTSGKGHKGQKSRSGAKIPPWFEGGQMPLQRRLPKFGFKRPDKVVFQVVNLDDIARRELAGEITPETLRQAGLVRSTKRPIKILGRGQASGILTVKVDAVSASAAQKIAEAGGTVVAGEAQTEGDTSGS